MPSSPPAPVVAAVRGAITVPENTAEAIERATARLLAALLDANGLSPHDLISALFTATPDLDADFPAHAARRSGWNGVPLLCAREIPVPGALPRVVRVLLTAAKPGLAPPLTPVYLEGAAALRPDLPAESAVAPEADAGRGPAPSPPPDVDGARRREPSFAPRPATASGAPRRRVAVIGLGQIGGSVALALGASGRWLRIGCDPSAAASSNARAAGAIDQLAESIEEACAGADLAVLAAPVDALPEIVDRAAAALPAGAALIDTGSARAGVTEALARAVTRGVRAIGGHPLAGTAGRGFAAARADLFRNTRFCLLPAGAGIPDAVSGLLEELGAHPLTVDPEEHDRALAGTSHLPYLLACALLDGGDPAARRGLTGPGFRDMTRLAGSDPAMALAYCRANRASIVAAWDALRADMERRIAALEAGAGA
jgi:monofunctional chorismate mutase